MSRRRHIAKAIRAQQARMPKHLTELGSPKFNALIEEREGSGLKWYVELTSLQYARLAKNASASAKQIAEKSRSIISLQQICAELHQELAQAKDKYEQHMKRHLDFIRTAVRENGSIEIPKSEMSYLELALKQGTNFGTPRRQGGLPGGGKG